MPAITVEKAEKAFTSMTNYSFLSPEHFTQYELLDSGNGEKLERFGALRLIRPEPRALWSPQLNNSEWESVADARFIPSDHQKGKWEYLVPKVKNSWKIEYSSPATKLMFELKLTQFKHIGLFPEQSSQWEYIHKQCIKRRKPKVLNLFAYTGGASLVARAAKADVIHLESMKQVVNWANRNQELSGLNDIRWLIEDAFKFVKRERKRGNYYNGIIMDPPAFGLGPKGERWKLEDQLNDLLRNVLELLVPGDAFFVLNTYSNHLSPQILKTMVNMHRSGIPSMEIGELGLQNGKQFLPTGPFLRFHED